MPHELGVAFRFALTRPAQVNIGEIVMWPTDQTSTTMVKHSSS